LQLVLPELLLLGLVEEGKLAHMVDEDVSKERELRVQRRDLAKVGLEGRAEASQRCGRVELRNLPFDLFGNEFALEICSKRLVRTKTRDAGLGGMLLAVFLLARERLAGRWDRGVALGAEGQLRRFHSSAIAVRLGF